MESKTAISLELSMYLRYLHQEQKIPIRDLVERYKDVSRATIYRHAKKTVLPIKKTKSTHGPGRKKLLSARDSRAVLRSVKKLRETQGRFSSKRVQKESCMDHVSNRTVRRLLNERGFHYLQARKS